VLGEEDASEAHRRLYNAAKAARITSIPADSIRILPLAGVPCQLIERDADGNIRDAQFLEWLQRQSIEGQYDLIVLDPLSRFAGLDAETDNASATRFIQAAESLAVASGAAVLVAHHTSKVSRTAGDVSAAASRGATALTDGARWVAALSAERVPQEDPDARRSFGEVVTFTIVKSNYAPKGEPMSLRRARDCGGALVPLDDADRDHLAEARRAADPRAVRDEARNERSKQRLVQVMEAIRVALRNAPTGLSYRELIATVRAELNTCARETFDAALAAMRHELSTHPGAKGAVLHSLIERAGIERR
jgi:RecA-family ATPase